MLKNRIYVNCVFSNGLTSYLNPAN